MSQPNNERCFPKTNHKILKTDITSRTMRTMQFLAVAAGTAPSNQELHTSFE